ncbi:MAG: glutamate 5-kinase [Lentisphaeria bacterium]|nr:glutamate 5-kinase [Lentisphaeria bacterium]
MHKKIIENTKRIVIKVGSQLLTNVDGESQEKRIELLVKQLKYLRDQGYEVILVSSGAIAAGIKALGLTKRPTDLTDLQALAALGQGRMMSIYEQTCSQMGFHCSQLLLCSDDVQDRRRHLNVRNCINRLLKIGIMPVINENDSVSTEEICFGENDRLAALVGTMMRADLTILLTTVNGLRDRNKDGSLAVRIPVINEVTDDIRTLASGTDGNAFSKGGMQTKLDAANMILNSGEAMWIADGTDFAVLQKMFKGEDLGTLFYPQVQQMSGQKRWLSFFADPNGEIVIDDGAVFALKEHGRSLLPSGICEVRGEFLKGDSIRILDLCGNLVATGISNYQSIELNVIKGAKSKDFYSLLGHHAYDEAIHRNNLALNLDH